MKLKQLAAVAAFALSTASVLAASNNISNTVALSASGTDQTAAFTAIHNVGSGAFTDTFTFNVTGDFTADSIISSIGFTAVTDIAFESIKLNGNAYTPVSTGAVEVWQLNPTPVTGPLTLTVVGSAGKNASYSGTLNLAAVPEPESLAMVMAGLAAVGFVVRRRA